jgi:hypothetical protein
MLVFDKQKVLERIIQEAPILSNRRGEIDIGRGKKGVIYAYYYNRGLPDPELHYDRVKAPAKTTPESTLCEIYSFWEGHPNVQDLIKRLTAERRIAPGQVLHQGPWLEEPTLGDDDVIAETRRGARYSLHRSGSAFSDHFNWTCEKLGFEQRLFSYEGRGAVIKVQRQVKIDLDGKVSDGNIKLIAPIDIDFDSEDPTLQGVLESISVACEKIRKFDLTSAELFVR